MLLHFFAFQKYEHFNLGSLRFNHDHTFYQIIEMDNGNNILVRIIMDKSKSRDVYDSKNDPIIGYYKFLFKKRVKVFFKHTGTSEYNRIVDQYSRMEKVLDLKW
jgi:hypothetical protein